MSNGQYTLDCDPMVLAKRVQTLEIAVDRLCAAVSDLARDTRLVADQCEKALCESHALQAKALYEAHENLNGVVGRAHAVSALMGRSY